MISILIPAYNAARFIEAAIMSCTRQVPDGAFEVLVCDDGSTDDTVAIVTALQEKVPQLRLLQNPENMGVCTARNAMLNALSPATQYVAFLDADDVYLDGALGMSIEKLLAEPDAMMTFGRLQVVRSDVLDQGGPFSDEWPIISGITLSSSVFRIKVVRMVGLFDTSFSQGEDVDYLLRLAELSDKRILLDDIIFYYRRHDANATNNTQIMKSGFMRALLLHAKRRAANPDLLAATGMFRVADRELLLKVERMRRV